jgi:hypothetical protein
MPEKKTRPKNKVVEDTQHTHIYTHDSQKIKGTGSDTTLVLQKNERTNSDI